MHASAFVVLQVGPILNEGCMGGFCVGLCIISSINCIYSDVDNFLNPNNFFHDFGRCLFQKLTISSYSFFPIGFGVIFGLSSSFWYVYFRFRAREQFFETFYRWAGGSRKSDFFKN